MSLVFSKLKEIELEDGVSIVELNNSMAKLLSNDIMLYIGNKDGMPQIWEMKWYNDQSVEKYNKGDAVWINTETWDNLVKSREADIIRYASSDPYLKTKFESLSDDTFQSERWSLCKKIADGSYNGRQLFYIGNPTNKIQVKISNCDDNDEMPSESSDKWDDLFQDFDIIKIKQQIISALDSKLETVYDQHVKDCHLSGIANDEEQLFDIYMKNDMSNSEIGPKFQSHFWFQDLNGVDQIKIYNEKRFRNGCVKWFRVWNSGLIEHGGIIDISNPQQGDVYDKSVYTVNLNWEYGDNKVAPIFDYGSGGLQKLYGPDKKYNINCTYYDLPKLNINSQNHMHIEVSPVNQNLVQPYRSELQGSNQAEVCFLKNDSFGIVVMDERINKYSYLVRGYSQYSRKF